MSRPQCLTLISFVSALFVSLTVAKELPTAKITVAVTELDTIPIDGAKVGVAGTFGAKPGEALKGMTGRDGTFAAEIRSTGEIGITVRKAGYYDNFGPDYNFRNIKSIDRAFADGRWDPWNPVVQVALKRIVNPTPMYARTIRRGLPADSKLALDLVTGDYLPPHGSGKQADITFELNSLKRARNDYDYNLTVNFASRFDGIIPFTVQRYGVGSKLRSPHESPADGFASEWIVWRSRRPGQPEKNNYDPETHAFFFRVRTVVDASGKIQSANYGKIYGDFMNFTYYLNPTPNDRNIEFDPKRNLFTNLKDEEKVAEP